MKGILKFRTETSIYALVNDKPRVGDIILTKNEVSLLVFGITISIKSGDEPQLWRCISGIGTKSAVNKVFEMPIADPVDKEAKEYLLVCQDSRLLYRKDVCVYIDPPKQLDGPKQEHHNWKGQSQPGGHDWFNQTQPMHQTPHYNQPATHCCRCVSARYCSCSSSYR